MSPIQRADPRARRRAIVLISVAFVVGVLSITAFELSKADFESWIEKNLPLWLDYPLIPSAMVLLFAAPAVGAAIYLFILGGRAAKTKRFPPPGYAVVRDTPIIDGPKAIRRGRLLQTVSALLACAAGAIPVFVWYLFALFSRTI